MADKSTQTGKKRTTQTVRQRSQQGEAEPKRRLRTTAHRASKPIGAGKRQLIGLLSPLSFLLIPLKTRPVRFVGRLLATILLFNYFASSWRELRAVEWPNKRETARLTVAVFMFSIIFGFIISTSDYGLDKLFHKILLR